MLDQTEIADRHAEGDADDRSETEAGEHPHRRGQNRDQHRDPRARSGIGSDPDLPTLSRVEEPRLARQIAEKDVRRRKQPAIGPSDIPQNLPDRGKETD